MLKKTQTLRILNHHQQKILDDVVFRVKSFKTYVKIYYVRGYGTMWKKNNYRTNSTVTNKHKSGLSLFLEICLLF